MMARMSSFSWKALLRAFHLRHWMKEYRTQRMKGRQNEEKTFNDNIVIW